MSLITSSVRNQLIAGFAAVFAVFAIGLGISIARLTSITNTLDAGAARVHLADRLSVDAYNIQGSQLMTAVDPAAATDHAHDVVQFRRTLATLSRDLSTRSDRAAYARIRTSFARWTAIDQRAVALARSGRLTEAQQMMVGSGAANLATDALSTAARDLAAHVLVEDHARGRSARASLLAFTIGLAVLGVLFSVAIILLLSRRIAGGVRQMLRALRGLARGETDQRIDLSGNDEIAGLARALSEVIDYLGETAAVAGRIAEGDFTTEIRPRSERDVLGQAFVTLRDRVGAVMRAISTTSATLNRSSDDMARTTEEVGRAIGEIAMSVSNVATGAEEQVTAIDDAERISSEMATASHSSSQAAAETASVAAQARSAAETGAGAMHQVDEAMRGVQESSAKITAAIETLGEKSTRIASIVDAIGGIAEQTNLLALNAAIEAARAGEHGRGFAVVAEEVRTLAEESSQAASTIATIVDEIRTEVEHAVVVVQRGAQEADSGIHTVQDARAAFREIHEGVQSMTARIEQIAGSSAQIVADAERMHASVHAVAAVAGQSSASTAQVSAATEQTSASTQQIAASAQSLSATAEELERLVAQFTLA